MLQSRLQQRLRLVGLPPLLLVLAIGLYAFLTSHMVGIGPREAVFDVFARTAPRPVVQEPDVALINIGPDSLENVGPWPWPRAVISRLVTAAQDAGATSVIVTTPVEGPDQLAPDVLRAFFTSISSEEVMTGLSGLPRGDSLLANTALGEPVALGLGAGTTVLTRWERTNLQGEDWISKSGDEEDPFLGLPSAPITREVMPELAAGLLAVSALPRDPDGTVRRVPLLWSYRGRPAPAAALSPLILADGTISVYPRDSERHAGGAGAAEIISGETTIPLETAGSVRTWLPRDLTLPSVPAWRILGGGSTWTGPLEDRTVFIGQTVTPDALVPTARGPIGLAQLHALVAQQIAHGHVLARPAWTGGLEGTIAIVFGLLAIAAAIYLRPVFSIALCIGLALVSIGISWLAFTRSGLLLDMSPALAAALVGPLAVFLIVVGNMLVRDDAMRSAFHGALPANAMQKLQSGGASKLLRGVRREVTVLSCGIRLPAAIMRQVEQRPDDFIRFTAAANDALRETILAHDGTVDYGEDGRLFGYWNVPETHEKPIEKACACALKMIDGVNDLAEKFRVAAFAMAEPGERLDDGFAESSVQIGIASSPCFAGPVGYGSRNRYAVIGEAVRLASALRQRAKSYGPAIITDDLVYDTLRHHYAFLDLDVVRAGEQSPPRQIYGLVGNPFLKASKQFRQLADIQRELVLSWRSGDLKKTTLALQRLRGIPGVPDVYVELYETRLHEARAATTERTDYAELLSL